MNELFTIDELSELLKIPKNWIYSRTRIKDENSIPCIRIGKYVRFIAADVIEWLKQQSHIVPTIVSFKFTLNNIDT